MTALSSPRPQVAGLSPWERAIADPPVPSVHVRASPATEPGDAAAFQDWLWAFAQQSLDYAILLVGLDQRVRWANPGAGWILAATTAELTGAPIERFFTAEDRALGIPAFEAQTAQRLGSSDDDRWMLRADGARFWAAGRTVALRRRDGSPLGFVKIFRDLTDLKMRLTRLGNQVRALGADDASRATAIASLAQRMHEPLASIAQAASQLRAAQERAQAPATDGGPLDVIERQLGVAAGRVAELERALHADARPMLLAIAPVRLDAELRAAIDSALQQRAGQARQIELLLPPGVPVTLEGDPLRLQQVFAHLVANALRFTTDDGRIWIHGTVEGRHVVVRVEDNGAGMEPAQLASLFELFTRAAGAPLQAGPDFGLSRVKAIVELHSGTLQAHSAGPGKGSQFIVRLPVRHPPTVPAQVGA